jgi:hypothetical protein
LFVTNRVERCRQLVVVARVRGEELQDGGTWEE